MTAAKDNRAELLGQSYGTSMRRLRKMLLWGFVQETDQNVCFRCGAKIDSIDDLSIEHKEPWQEADNPKAAFFDLKNIAFSHLSCNLGAARLAKTHCPQGHPYSGDNLYTENYGNSKIRRRCRQCSNNRAKRYYYQQQKRVLVTGGDNQ